MQSTPLKEEYMLKEIDLNLYDELCRTLTDFENASDDEEDDDYLSDGEWLDIFYELCCSIQRELN